MEADTRKVIEESYGQFQKQMAEGTEMTPAGQLMYTLLVAVIELDNKVSDIEKAMTPDDDKFTFFN